ncbi:glucose-dependent insulinotropic receptor [Aplochiton taeniatus]
MGWVLSVGSGLIISTNLLVAAALLALIRRRARGSQSWWFVLNLALADIFVGAAITGIAMDNFKAARDNNSTSIQGSAGFLRVLSTPSQRNRCLLEMAFVTSPSTASILSMFLISLDRYAAIKLPLRYPLLSGRGTVAGALGALWCCALLLGFLPVMVPPFQRDYFGVCTFFSVVRPQCIIVVFCVCFFPVLSTFVYIYLDILKIACGHQKQIGQAQAVSCRLPQRSSYWAHVKALRTVAVLVGCFTLSWCPFFLVCVVQMLCEACELYRHLESHLWLLGLSNSVINPLVYACWQREVRWQLAAMFSCFKERQGPTGAHGGPRGPTGASENTARCDTYRTSSQHHPHHHHPRHLHHEVTSSGTSRDPALLYQTPCVSEGGGMDSDTPLME